MSANEEAVQNIKAMFANIPEATIRKTLKQVHFDVDSAVDILLSMDTYELPEDEVSSVSTDVAETESSGGAGGSGDGTASDGSGERSGSSSDGGSSTPKLLPKSEAAAALQVALQESVLAAADADILNSYDEALAQALRQLFVS